MNRVLCLAAHPDDVEVYMGGALLGFMKAGWEVQVWIATRGEKGRLQPQQGSRMDEARAALGSLGIPVEVQGLEDGGLADSQGLERILHDLIAKWRPRLLFAPHPCDAHADHAALGACVHATEMGTGTVLWHWLDANPRVEPSHFLDLGSSLAAKLALIGYHKSQIPGPEGPRDHLPDGRDILQRAEHRDRGHGAAQGRVFLEPFLAPGSRRSESPCILESVQEFLDSGHRESGGSS